MEMFIKSCSCLLVTQVTHLLVINHHHHTCLRQAVFTLLPDKPPAFSSAIWDVWVPQRKPLTDALGRDGDGLCHLRSSCLTKQYSSSLCRNASHLCFPNKPEEQRQWEAPNLTNSNSLFCGVVQKETTTTWDLLLVWLVSCFYPSKASSHAGI